MTNFIEEQQKEALLTKVCEIFSESVDCEVQEGSTTMSVLAKIVILVQEDSVCAVEHLLKQYGVDSPNTESPVLNRAEFLHVLKTELQ